MALKTHYIFRFFSNRSNCMGFAHTHNTNLWVLHVVIYPIWACGGCVWWLQIVKLQSTQNFVFIYCMCLDIEKHSVILSTKGNRGGGILGKWGYWCNYEGFNPKPHHTLLLCNTTLCTMTYKIMKCAYSFLCLYKFPGSASHITQYYRCLHTHWALKEKQTTNAFHINVVWYQQPPQLKTPEK